MSTIINANDSNIKYSPYNWYVSVSGAKTICSGAYLFLEFSGSPTTLTANFDITNMLTPASKVGFRIDNGAWQYFSIASSVNLALATGNTWSKHTVEMLIISTTETQNRWNAPQNTAVIFTGLTADIDISSLPVTSAPLYGLLIGDSITEGVRTLNMTATYDTDRNDVRLAWSYPLKDLLGAEIGVVGFGATGINKTGSGNVPRFCDSIPYLFSGQARDLSTPQAPDFIIANIGTNDSATTDADAVTYTLQFINYLLSQTPSTTKIFIYAGWLQRKAAQIQQACQTCNTPSRVTYIDTTGWWSTADSSDSLHPYGYVNISDLSLRLASTVKPYLESSPPSNYFIKSASGEAVAISVATN